MASKKISQLPSGSLNIPLSGQTAVVYSGVTHQQSLTSLRQVLVDNGSHHFTGSQYIDGSLTITGRIPSLIVGTGSFHVSNPEVLHVESSGSYNIAHFQGNNNIYSQVNIQNTNSGNNASTDLVLTADNGTENVHYIDLGINSSTYTGGLVGSANDSYLLNVGKDMYIGTVGGINHPANLKLFAQNSWENPQIIISGSKQISFNTGSVSNGYQYEFSGSVKLDNNLSINGVSNFGSTTEIIVPFDDTNTLTHDFNNGTILYVTNLSGNATIDLTNVPTENNKAIGLTVMVEQGSTPFIVNTLQINNNNEGSVVITWYGGAEPTLNANKLDIFSFSLLKINNTWRVFGQLTTF